MVLDHVRFIHDHVVPHHRLQNTFVLHSEIVGGDAHVESELVPPPAFPQFSSTLWTPVVADNLESRKELLELHFPVQDYTVRNDLQSR